MAKGQKRGNREAKKPKQSKPTASPPTLFRKSEDSATANAHQKAKGSHGGSKH
jgi:hypothetical protein